MTRSEWVAAVAAGMLAIAPGLAQAQGLPNSLQKLLGGNGVSQDQAVRQAYQQGYQDGMRQRGGGNRSDERSESRRRSDQDNYSNGSDNDQSRQDYQGGSNNGGYGGTRR